MKSSVKKTIVLPPLNVLLISRRRELIIKHQAVGILIRFVLWTS